MRNLCEKFTLIRTLANCLFYYQPAFQEHQILEEHFHRILWSPVESMFPLTHGQHDLLMKTVKIEITTHLINFRTAQGLQLSSEAQRLGGQRRHCGQTSGMQEGIDFGLPFQSNFLRTISKENLRNNLWLAK